MCLLFNLGHETDLNCVSVNIQCPPKERVTGEMLSCIKPWTLVALLPNVFLCVQVYA